MEQLLDGVKVLDLTWHIAGPFCSKLVADCGAEVIKIEKPGTGDPSRKVGPFPGDIPHPEKSALYLYLNTNKKSITLDLKSRFGQDIVKELAKSADMVIESFRPGVMDRFGLGYETLEKINPKLVMVSVSSFGQTGPYRDWKADENILHAMGGLTATSGDTSMPPVRQGGSQAQYIGGLHAFTGTMIAFHCQQVSGIGQHVDQSILESWLYHLEMPGYYLTGRIRDQLGSFESALMGTYPTKDGYCGIAGVGRGASWEAFKKLVGNPALDDPKFGDAHGRWLYSDELIAHIMVWTSEHTMREVYDLLQGNGMAAGMVIPPGDLLQDRQLKARGFFTELNHPVAGKIMCPTTAAQFNEAQPQIRRSPTLGEHNEEIFCGRLGYSHDDLAHLREQGVV